MGLSLGNAVNLAIGTLLIAKVAFIFWGTGLFHYSLYWVYVFLGALGLLLGKPRSMVWWLPVALVLAILVLAGLDIVNSRSEGFGDAQWPYFGLQILGGFTAIFLWRHRAWLRLPRAKDWLWTGVGLLLILVLSVSHMLPVALRVAHDYMYPGNGLPLQVLTDDQLKKVVIHPTNEELGRLGLHLLGTHPFANAALFAIVHHNTDPAGIQQVLLRRAQEVSTATERYGDFYIREIGFYLTGILYDAAFDRETLQQITVLRLASLWLTGYIFLLLLLRTQSIWPPLVAHVLANSLIMMWRGTP